MWSVGRAHASYILFSVNIMATVAYRRTSTLWIWVGIVALIVGAFFAIRTTTREIVEVKTAPVSYQDLLSTVSTNGRVQPVHEFQAHAPVAAVVDNIYVQLGDHVKPGQLLIRMADADARARLATASSALVASQRDQKDTIAGGSQDERNRNAAELQADKLEIQQAQSNLALTQQLQQKGAASASEVASAQQRVDTANTALKNAQIRTGQRFSDTDRSTLAARVADARANVAAAESGLDSSDIHSPIAGTVYSLPVSRYDYIQGGGDLVDVADLNNVRVFAYFDEPEIGKLLNGLQVKIVWDAKPNQTWHGHIETAPRTIILYGTRSVGECVITVDDAKGDLPPNSNVTVFVTESERPHVLSIPHEALHFDGPSAFVYRVLGHHLVRTPVTVGLENVTRVEITGGLTDKDVVALNATNNRDLTNGLEVKPLQ